MGRMTLQGALRFDHAWSFSPAQTIGRPIATFLADAAVVPANRRRQLQGHLAARRRRLRRVRQRQDGGQGELRQVPGAGEQPEQQLLDQQPDRAHRDDDDADVDRRRTNGDIAGLRSRNATARTRRQRRVRAGDEPPTFGTATPTTAAIDPTLLNGWGVRPSDWQIGASVQQQLLPRVSVEVGYFRRWLQQLHRDRQPARRRRPTSRRSASRRRPIRGCPAAAATPSPACTTSSQASSARRSNNITDAGELRRPVPEATTASWSTVSARDATA